MDPPNAYPRAPALAASPKQSSLGPRRFPATCAPASPPEFLDAVSRVADCSQVQEIAPARLVLWWKVSARPRLLRNRCTTDPEPPRLDSRLLCHHTLPHTGHELPVLREDLPQPSSETRRPELFSQCLPRRCRRRSPD